MKIIGERRYKALYEIDLEEGVTKIQQCDLFLDKVFDDNVPMMENYGKILALAEETGKCSGMCPRPNNDLRS